MKKESKSTTPTLVPNTITPKYFDKYVIVPYRALCIAELSCTDAIVYGYLNEFARNNVDHAVWEHAKSISKKLNIHRNTVLKSLESLNKIGLIEIHQGKDNNRVYKVLKDLRDSQETFGLDQFEDEGDYSDIEEDMEEGLVPQRVKDILKTPLVEPKEEKKASKPAKTPKKAVEVLGDDDMDF